jgi:hypothetical protein
MTLQNYKPLQSSSVRSSRMGFDSLAEFPGGRGIRNARGLVELDRLCPRAARRTLGTGRETRFPRKTRR